MSKRKAVFLDKDGTLIPDIPYNVNPDLITLQEGVIEGLQLLQEQEYLFVVISNQAGVARGYFQLDDLKKVRQKIDLLVSEGGIQIDRYYFCPHHPEGRIAEFARKCECRKPRPGMILKALQELDIDAGSSWMIGDILNDVEAGNRAGCRSVLIGNGNETEWLPGTYRTPSYIAMDFLSAARFIINNPHETAQVNDRKLAPL
jgi:D-glycero-D-manno-heptose 1,7-bisphosphate phosphatase